MRPNRRAKIEDEPPQRRDCLVQPGGGVAEFLRQRWVDDAMGGRLQTKSDGKNVLDDGVMQVPSDAFAVFDYRDSSQTA